METLKNLVTIKRGIEHRIKTDRRHLDLISREIQKLAKHSDGAGVSVDSHGFKKPVQPSGHDGAEVRGWRVWEKLPDSFNIKKLHRLADKGQGSEHTLTHAAYFHVVSRWVDMGLLEVAEEGSGQKPTQYRKVKQ